MEETQKAYQFLEAFEQAENHILHIEFKNLDEKLLDKLVMLGVLKKVSGDYEEVSIKMTLKGFQMLELARKKGEEKIDWSMGEQIAGNIQNVYGGVVNNQIGSHNVIKNDVDE